MRISYILIIFLTINLNGIAQNDENYFGLNTNVLKNVDVSHPTINIGVDRYFGKHNISVKFGFFYRNYFSNEPSNGLTFGAEYKLFRNKGMYFAAGTDVGIIEYEDNVRVDIENNDFIIDNYDIEKFRADLYFTFGFRKKLGQKFYLDYFGGLGLRFKNTEHFNRLEPENEEELNFTLYDIRDESGETFALIFKLGVRLGIKL